MEDAAKPKGKLIKRWSGDDPHALYKTPSLFWRKRIPGSVFGVQAANQVACPNNPNPAIDPGVLVLGWDSALKWRIACIVVWC